MPFLAWVLLAAGCAVPARAEGIHVRVTSVRVDDRSIRDLNREIRIQTSDSLHIMAACDPQLPDALFMVRFEGAGDWSMPQPAESFSLAAPGVGKYRLMVTARSSKGAWAADTVSLRVTVFRSDGRSGRAMTAEGRVAAGRPTWRIVLGWIAIGLSMAVALIVLVWFLSARLRRRRKGSRRPRGPIIRLESSPEEASRVKEMEGELNRLHGQLRELHERSQKLKNSNAELQQKAEALERANREQLELKKSRDEVLSMLAHDIKNPAGAVQMLAEILHKSDLSAEEQKRIVGEMMEVSSRIVKISQDLSDALVMEVRSLTLDLKMCRLDEIVTRVCRTNRMLAGQKEIALETEIPRNLPKAEVDEGRIEEVLDNLVNNAIKFSQPKTRVRVVARVSGPDALIDVVDSGPGLSEADLQQAFKFGQKLSAQPSGGEKSSGLGLWISRKIVEGHRGHIFVRSTPGMGATFTVQIPLRWTGPDEAQGN